jgi:monothiol glutaredoxin
MKGNPATPQCGFSRAVVQILDIHGVSSNNMKTFDVLEDQSLRNDIKEFSCVYSVSLLTLQLILSREWPTIPQIYVNGEFVGGCDILLSSECAQVPRGFHELTLFQCTSRVNSKNYCKKRV